MKCTKMLTKYTLEKKCHITRHMTHKSFLEEKKNLRREITAKITKRTEHISHIILYLKHFILFINKSKGNLMVLIQSYTN